MLYLQRFRNNELTKKPIRVLMVTGAYPTEQHTHAGTFIKSQVESLIAADIEAEIIHPKPGPVLLRYARAAMQVFLKTLAGHFDVVHGHYATWCLVARMQWTTPVVASFLGTDLLGIVAADGGYSSKGALFNRISLWLCRRVDAVIVKSEGMKKTITGGEGSVCRSVEVSPRDRVADRALRSGGDIFVIPNGVDFELFHPIPRVEARAALGWDPDRYYVLFGNDPKIPVKNFPLAQAAIESLRGRGVPAELVVARGLSQTTLVQYINASNALILSSIAEGSPNIVKEAMACNVPVVSTDVGDVSKVIGNTRGCSICPHDPEVLAAALEQALQHTESTTGRMDIMHLERSVVAKQVIAVYERVIREKIKRKGKTFYEKEATGHGNNS